MDDLVLAFTVGLVVGITFALLKLPIPAPQTIGGLLGIIGIVVGYLIIKYIA